MPNVPSSSPVKAITKNKIAYAVIIVLLPVITSFTKPVEDKFRVIKVIGNILIKATGALLQQGDIINSSETIVFKTPDAKASVMSEKRGRFIITQSTNLKEAALKTNLLPAMSNISSRSGPINNKIDLQNHFRGDLILLDKSKLFINSKAYPMNKTNFFFIRYKHNGENIDKKLNFQTDTLIIDKKELLTIDNVPVAVPHELESDLYYYTGNGATLINNFRLIFPDHSSLKKEISILLQEMKNKDDDVKINEITSYIAEFYGKPDQENLKQWLRSNLGFK